ncbi:MAG: NTP transferase domain-containing protein, partial [Immundisolibacter sp.]|uniref:NTP transferase domain-containing protein n=1 Tax=Immundisolibacter sp. TaxID=1934948 RepID=UPI003D0A66A0
MQAVILSAGQGRRLLPLTADRPKCLVDLHGKTLLQWQLDALLAAGVGPVTVVTGYASDAVEAV